MNSISDRTQVNSLLSLMEALLEAPIEYWLSGASRVGAFTPSRKTLGTRACNSLRVDSAFQISYFLYIAPSHS